MAVQLVSRDYSSDRLYRAATQILNANLLCSIATEQQPGHPHIHTAFFAFSADLDLFFLSHPASVHSHNLGHVPRIAIAVFDSHQAWGDPHAGLQLFGQAEPARSVHLERARTLYTARFPRYTESMSSADRSPATASLHLYRFRPDRFKIFDETNLGIGVPIAVELHR